MIDNHRAASASVAGTLGLIVFPALCKWVLLICIAASAGCKRTLTTVGPSKSDEVSPRKVSSRLCKDGLDGPSLSIGPINVSGGHIHIFGRTSPGASVYVNGVHIDVQRDGKFAALIANYAWKETVVGAFKDGGCSEWHSATETLTSAETEALVIETDGATH